MEFLVNVLIFTDFFLGVALGVALWERYDNQHYPKEGASEIAAKEQRKRQVLDSWRR